MNVPPQPLPETGKAAALFRWLNQLRAFSISAQPKPAINSTWERSSIGTIITPKPGGDSAPATDDLTWL